MKNTCKIGTEEREKHWENKIIYGYCWRCEKDLSLKN